MTTNVDHEEPEVDDHWYDPLVGLVVWLVVPIATYAGIVWLISRSR